MSILVLLSNLATHQMVHVQLSNPYIIHTCYSIEVEKTQK